MSNTAIRLHTGIKINQGQLEVFKELATKVVIKVEAEEPNTLVYEWYINTEGDTCYVSEYFSDSKALVKHLTAAGEYLPPLLEVCSLTQLLVLGSPSKEATEILSGLGAQFFSRKAGFTR